MFGGRPGDRGANPLLVVLAIGLAVLVAVKLAGRQQTGENAALGPDLPNVVHPRQPRVLRPTGPGATPAALAGAAHVIDGDTIVLSGRHVRLFGIDAPETRQRCERGGVGYDCGQAAMAYLQSLVGGQQVSCRVRDTDQYERQVAVCSAGGQDLNAAMVRAGWALAYRQYGTDYVGDEAAARRAHAGLWAGRFEPPWEWRHANR